MFPIHVQVNILKQSQAGSDNVAKVSPVWTFIAFRMFKWAKLQSDGGSHHLHFSRSWRLGADQFSLKKKTIFYHACFLRPAHMMTPGGWQSLNIWNITLMSSTPEGNCLISVIFQLFLHYQHSIYYHHRSPFMFCYISCLFRFRKHDFLVRFRHISSLLAAFTVNVTEISVALCCKLTSGSRKLHKMPSALLCITAEFSFSNFSHSEVSLTFIWETVLFKLLQL